MTHPQTHSSRELEAALKSTLHTLSLLLSFHSSVQQLAVAPYAPHPPRQHTQQIQLDSAKFAAACAAIEHRLLRAIAVLERDARKASGQPPLVPTPPRVLSDADADAEPELAAKGESPAPPFPFAFADLGLPLPVPAPLDEMDLDDSLLDDSLFGDSTAPSPAAGPSEPAPFDLADLDTGAAVVAPSLPESTPMPDLNTLLAMVTSAGADNLPANEFVLPPPQQAAFALPPTDFNPLDPYGLHAFDGSAALGDLSGDSAPPGGVDLSTYFGSGDLAMGDGNQVDLDALMKSLGAST